MSIKGIFPIEKWTFGRESILSSLPPADQESLFVRKSERLYHKGEIIFREDGYPAAVHYVVKGMVKKYKIDHDGYEQILYLAGPEEMLGYHAVISRSKYVNYASALEESLIASIPKEDFLHELERSKPFAQRLLEVMSHECAVMANNMSVYSSKTVRERLALQLVILREKYKSATLAGQPVMINLGREDLANLVGTARENVIRMLAELKDEGILETMRRKIIVKDVKKLIDLSNCAF